MRAFTLRLIFLFATAGLCAAGPATAAVQPAALVADSAAHSIVYVDPATGAQGRLAALAAPTGVAIASGGAVYATDDGGPAPGSVVRIDTVTGAVSPVASGAPIDHPAGLVVTTAGDLLVAQPDGGPKGDGALLRVSPLSGLTTVVSDHGKLGDPIDVALGPAGQIYVLDRKDDPWGPGKSRAGAVLVVDPADGDVARLSKSHTMYKPTALAVAADGAILVTDERDAVIHGAVLRIDSNTGAVADLTSGGLLQRPSGVALNGSSVLVADKDAFGGLGGIITAGLSGSAQSQVTAGGLLDDPEGIALGMVPVPPGGIAVQPPRLASVVNIELVRGVVRFAPPSQGRPSFGRLTGSQQVPVGSIIDATRGTLGLTSAKPDGTTQSGRFSGGMFRVGQSTSGRVNLKLRGALPRCRPAASASARKRNKRRLWGDAHGAFQTRGRNSSATVRGTRWLVEDRCGGTLTKVARGLVQVRDKLRHRTVMVPKGHSYLARNRDRRR